MNPNSFQTNTHTSKAGCQTEETSTDKAFPTSDHLPEDLGLPLAVLKSWIGRERARACPNVLRAVRGQVTTNAVLLRVGIDSCGVNVTRATGGTRYARNKGK